jgi:hypothetical protein
MPYLVGVQTDELEWASVNVMPSFDKASIEGVVIFDLEL